MTFRMSICLVDLKLVQIFRPKKVCYKTSMSSFLVDKPNILSNCPNNCTSAGSQLFGAG